MHRRQLSFSLARLILSISCLAAAFALFRIATTPLAVVMGLFAVGAAVGAFFEERVEGALAGMAAVFVLIVIAAAYPWLWYFFGYLGWKLGVWQ
ncbi:MAG: hypothetical protein JNK76_16100 [Planctomycetales bacterium]|nr:hypothetical protein [Planctomycetales bacterium]MBN8628148.1 hypothetical protein [Planctomycetota bacterium]